MGANVDWMTSTRGIRSLVCPPSQFSVLLRPGAIQVAEFNSNFIEMGIHIDSN